MIIIGESVSGEFSEELSSLGFAVVRLTSFGTLPAPVSSHPDMLLFPSEGEFLTFPGYLAEASRILNGYGISCRAVEETGGDLYPADVALNALEIGGAVYGHGDAVAKEIKRRAARFVSVKQGYARCSCAVVADRAVVTADTGLAKALSSDGIDVLTIRPGHIRLDGYDTGFIGGCGGRLDERRYAFFGNVLSHPDGEAIFQFAKEHGTEIISLGDGELRDYGGIIAVKQKNSAFERAALEV